jgi:type IX secretion system PorP/SprF family membrane protein
MKRLLMFYLLILVSAENFAQQDPLYSQYINNPFVINPAYTGLTDNLSMAVSYRNQWGGYEGSPKTINANGHMSLFNNRAGTGLMLVSDQIGGSTISEAMGSFSYRINVASDKIFSFGLQAGVTNFRVDNSKVNPFDKNDPLFQGSISETKPTIGFGVILKNDKFFTGISVPRMLKSTFDLGGQQASLYTQHYYAIGSYLFFLSERIRLKPSALLKIVKGAPTSFDLNASLIIHENYQAGVLTRDLNTYGLFMQAIFSNSLRLGYVFEVPTNASVGARFTTHEITLGFRMNMLPYHNNMGVLSF